MTQYHSGVATSARDDGGQPPYLYPDYVGTRLRAPLKPLIVLPESLADDTGPVFGRGSVGERDNDLTRRHRGEPLGERIIVSGRVLDDNGRPVKGGLIEVWQANAAGRYAHDSDQHPAPLDPNFVGAGRCLTDDHGRYAFVTIKPGAYPWQNHNNAWRPAHIHFSLFGQGFGSHLVTQMYFPGDPLFDQDPIFQLVRDPAARQLMIASLSAATDRSASAGPRYRRRRASSTRAPIRSPGSASWSRARPRQTSSSTRSTTAASRSSAPARRRSSGSTFSAIPAMTWTTGPTTGSGKRCA
ncbi:MAG: protocatechuate 3,4-dioxygenase subunit beta [Dehalococcoidia bacterium]|nr:protocatechuate 3,4-dioxygenase subunit beta [Dehalococcoidia bacterium]